MSDQRYITDYARNTDSNASPEDKLDKVLVGVEELKDVPCMVECLKTEISQLRGEVLEMTNKIRSLEQEINRHQREKEHLAQATREATYVANMAWKKIDDLEQWSRRSNARIVNLPDSDRYEPHFQTLQKVIFFTRDLGLTNFTPDLVDICHRVGRFDPQGKPRQIIVKFLRRTTKLDVMEGRRRTPRGAPFLVEDLTKRRYQLLAKARNLSGTKGAWSKEGKIYIRLANGRALQITEDTDWTSLQEQTGLALDAELELSGTGRRNRQSDPRAHHDGINKAPPRRRSSTGRSQSTDWPRPQPNSNRNSSMRQSMSGERALLPKPSRQQWSVSWPPSPVRSPGHQRLGIPCDRHSTTTTTTAEKPTKELGSPGSPMDSVVVQPGEATAEAPGASSESEHQPHSENQELGSVRSSLEMSLSPQPSTDMSMNPARCDINSKTVGDEDTNSGSKVSSGVERRAEHETASGE